MFAGEVIGNNLESDNCHQSKVPVEQVVQDFQMFSHSVLCKENLTCSHLRWWMESLDTYQRSHIESDSPKYASSWACSGQEDNFTAFPKGPMLNKVQPRKQSWMVNLVIYTILKEVNLGTIPKKLGSNGASNLLTWLYQKLLGWN